MLQLFKLTVFESTGFSLAKHALTRVFCCNTAGAEQTARYLKARPCALDLTHE
jgi:hypothetical protein